MNVLSITGNLTKDIELKKTTNGTSVVSSTVAVQRAYKGQDGAKAVDFIDFVAWDKKAEYLAKYAKKGDRVEMMGRLESRKFTDRNGQERLVWECIAENVMCFSRQEKPAATVINDDDLPF